MLSEQPSTHLEAGFAELAGHFSAVAEQTERARVSLAGALRGAESAVIALKARYDARLKATKGRFNLFTILRGIGEEVGLHSQWLAFLLDPQAAHDCGAMFLRLFVEALQKGVQPHADDAAPCKLDFLDSFDCDTATVRIEVSGDGGRMDIVIDCPSWGVIAIENKVWAGEQGLQIERYAKELERTCGHRQRKSLLIFLTLKGLASKEAGAYSDNYYRASYQHHILPWLEECLRAAYRFPNINLALQQYVAAVGELTGSGGDQEFMKDIIGLLKEHPSLIANMSAIQKAHEQLRSDYWADFVRALRLQLRARGIE